jgi:hypothetical protein
MSENDIDPQELDLLIAEMQEYRDRLLNDTLDAGKKAKLAKSQVMAKIEPELAQLDNTLKVLREKQAAFTNS